VVAPGLGRVAGGGCGTDAPAEVPAGIGRPPYLTPQSHTHATSSWLSPGPRAADGLVAELAEAGDGSVRDA